MTEKSITLHKSRQVIYTQHIDLTRTHFQCNKSLPVDTNLLALTFSQIFNATHLKLLFNHTCDMYSPMKCRNYYGVPNVQKIKR